MTITKRLFGAIAALLAALMLTSVGAFAVGPGSGKGGGKPTTEATNNLSVPAVFIDSAGFGLTSPLLQYPTTMPSTGFTEAGYYYVQGVDKWQAEYSVLDTDTVTAKWGDNLSGDARLKAGSPVRVEMVLTSATTTLQGFTVIKLEPNELDRLAPYGTLATATTETLTGYTATATPIAARVYVAGATLTITGANGSTTVPLPGEINATGGVVFGYNWRPSEPGEYTLSFNVPADTVSYTNPADTVKTVTVVSNAGGGGSGRPLG